MVNLFTQDEVTALCRQTGFTADQAKIAGAIAMAETNTIVNGKQFCDFAQVGDQQLATAVWGFSYGAFQVRSLRAQKGTNQFRDEDRLPEPTFNTISAHTIFLQSGFQAWSTYNSGAYKGFLIKDYPAPQGTYRVTGGDNLTKIGKLTGYDWHLIAEANNLVSPYTIFPGQVLLLPDFPYAVVKGDTLSAIVKHYAEHQTVAYVAQYNHMADPNKLSIGQVINIPRIVPA